MSTLEEIKTKIEAIKKQKEELTAKLRNDFAPMLQPLFEKSEGKIKSIGWIQYTPYFNDGEECTFSTNFDLDYGLRVNGKRLDDEYDDEDEKESVFGCSLYALRKYGTDDYVEWIKKYPEDTIKEESKESDLALYACLKEFEEILESIDDEFYKDLFGDHVEVTVHSNGVIETEEYDHD
jgi:hypothetical protein